VAGLEVRRPDYVDLADDAPQIPEAQVDHPLQWSQIGAGVGNDTFMCVLERGDVAFRRLEALRSHPLSQAHAAAAEAVEGRPATAALPLGPDARLVDVLVDRLTQAGLAPGDAVVLAAAGSTDPAAAVAVEEVAAGLAARLGRPVTVGYGAGSTPRVPDAVAAARATAPGRVVIASYLLAPGYFHDRVLDAGADVVSAPLAPDDRIVAIVLDRYAAAAATLTGSAAGRTPRAG